MKIRGANRAVLKHLDFKIPEYSSRPAKCPTFCCLFMPVYTDRHSMCYCNFIFSKMKSEE